MDRPSLSLLRVTDMYEALILRELRNECREFMTGNQDEITVDQQATFFKERLAKHPEEIEAYILFDGTEPIGFGVITFSQNDLGYTTAHPTYGLAKAYRGRGLGRPLAEMIISLAWAANPHAVMGELLVGNEAVTALDLKIGWRFIRTAEKNGRLIWIVEHIRDRAAQENLPIDVHPVVGLSEVCSLCSPSLQSPADALQDRPYAEE